MALELSDLTIGQAGDLLAQGDLTSTELTRAVLDRIATVEERTKAFVTVTETRLRIVAFRPVMPGR